MMRSVRQSSTEPELRVRQILSGLGVHYRLNARSLPGSPDMSNRRAGWAIFVHGCFWHGHRDCRKTKGGAFGRIPATNRHYWLRKIEDNRARDDRKESELKSLGLRVRSIWECELADRERLAVKLAEFVGGRD